MKNAIGVLVLVLLMCSASNAQYIPFTNTIRIYDLDTGGVMRFYKIPLPQAGYKNFYVQRSGIENPPNIYDMRNGNVYRYLYNIHGFTDSIHNRRFRNSWTYQYGWNSGYLLEAAFSRQDTNLFVYSYKDAFWEPAGYMASSINNGFTVSNIYTTGISPSLGGIAIDPVNDSIMYIAFRPNSTTGDIHKSTNRGANWFCTDTITGGVSGSRLFINYNIRNTIFMSLGSNLLRSTTGGTDFQVTKTGVPNGQMYFEEGDNGIYFCNTSVEGLLKSTNNGTNWTVLMNKAVNDIEFDPLNGNVIYAGCADGLYKSSNKGITWTLYNNSFSPDLNVKGIVKYPNMGDTLFVSTNKAVYKVFGQAVADTSVTNYFPMAVGNVYVYGYYSMYPPGIYKFKITIKKDTVISGKRFYYSETAFPGFPSNEKWIRINGNTGVVSTLSNMSCNYLINERYIDSLGSNIRDTLYKCSSYFQSICTDTMTHSIFGIPTKRKGFDQDGLNLTHRRYSKYFGLTMVRIWEMDQITYTLYGCKINGVTYGDTLLTGVESISSEVPDSYSLGQNYPNPFNPNTVIRYQLPVVSDVVIKVYDVQGREVQTLVNERIGAGTYEVSFDGSGLNSGVYFYQMTAGNYGETKRMILLK